MEPPSEVNRSVVAIKFQGVFQRVGIDTNNVHLRTLAIQPLRVMDFMTFFEEAGTKFGAYGPDHFKLTNVTDTSLSEILEAVTEESRLAVDLRSIKWLAYSSYFTFRDRRKHEVTQRETEWEKIKEAEKKHFQRKEKTREERFQERVNQIRGGGYTL